MTLINRGSVWWVDFNPSVGGEIKKTRPAIVVSNNISNNTLNRVQVVPVTSNIRKCYPFEVFVMIKNRKSTAKADQITTVSKKRLKKKITNLTDLEMLKIENILKLQLALFIV